MEDQHHSGHEHTDASIRGIVITAAALAIAVALVCFAMRGIFWYLAEHPLIGSLSSPRPNPMAESGDQLPPQPRIEEHPAIEIHELHSEEDRILSTYGWTDKQKGIVRIPLDRAMELQLERGFPTAPGSKTGGKK